VDPFQTHYFSENQVALGIEPGIAGSVARNSDHYTTEVVAVKVTMRKIQIFRRVMLCIGRKSSVLY
jgi:predicted Kef-type K+ transport protein